MICPKCGWSEANHVKKAQSDKEKYLEFWGYTLDTPEAEEAWKLKQEMTFREAPIVMSDIQGYVSQIDGSWIDSRSKHRNHLKEHKMIELGNDVPMRQPDPEVSKQSQQARKRQIAELAYAKLR